MCYKICASNHLITDKYRSYLCTPARLPEFVSACRRRRNLQGSEAPCMEGTYANATAGAGKAAAPYIYQSARPTIYNEPV